ncbi:MAG TPA: ABC transporter ATP-binding protein [candidate division Zixibacteria bacterium]|nr:ABC transporter ATP-binding protein [candidate division Zixibacteria bacterium]
MLEIKNFTKRYGDVVAVDSLNLSVDRGELFGFLGPNGAGKTTTIKTIVGLLRPDEGQITIGGYDIVAQPEQAKRLIGYIPDNPYIYDRLTGREFLELVGSLYGMDKKLIQERIEFLFDLFGIEEWGDEYAAEYSHGMRQKVIMASAIMHDPALIVIDEPMVGLDPQSQRLVKGVMRKLIERGTAIFMSTHTLAVAEEVCTRIGIIHKGKLMKVGTLEQLRADAKMEGKSLEDLFVALTGGEREIKLWDQ